LQATERVFFPFVSFACRRPRCRSPGRHAPGRLPALVREG